MARGTRPREAGTLSAIDHAISVFAMLLAVGIIGFAWWRKAPIVMGVVIANFAVFILTILRGDSQFFISGPLVEDLAARVVYLSVDHWPRLYTIFTATFLHADLGHLLGNMLVLILIGLPFEDRVGPRRFLIVYFWSAIVAVLLHAAYIHMVGDARDQLIPLVGASGAVFGILGAFATMYPWDKIRFPVFFLIRMPVVFGALILVFLEYAAISSGGLGRVAHAAHIGGAVGGVIVGMLFRPSRATTREGEGASRAIHYDVLERLATTPQQRGWIQKMRENEDHPETRRAWLERLVPSLRCPQHDQPYQARGRNRLVCPGGHEERYAD